MKKILVSTWLFEGVQVLIPKKRGDGFLKVPAGHHHEHWMNDIPYDVDGLDGHLNIDCGFVGSHPEKLNAILAEIMPVICKRFGFPWELIDSHDFAKLAS